MGKQNYSPFYMLFRLKKRVIFTDSENNKVFLNSSKLKKQSYWISKWKMTGWPSWLSGLKQKSFRKRNRESWHVERGGLFIAEIPVWLGICPSE